MASPTQVFAPASFNSQVGFQRASHVSASGDGSSRLMVAQSSADLSVRADPGAHTVILLTKASPMPQQQEKALCACESLRELQDGFKHYGEHQPSAS